MSEEGTLSPEGTSATGQEDDNSEGPVEPPNTRQLRVERLVKTFGGLVAVDEARFDVTEGCLTGLIGPNGAGKTTTFDCITGTYPPDEGNIFFEGKNITGLRPNEISNHGLVRTFQIARELEEMTVLENMMLAPQNQLGESVVHSVFPGLRNRVQEDESELRSNVWETLEFFEIDHLAGEFAGNLSGGQRKLLEIARALMTAPQMMLLDEPFAGVNPSLEQKIIERVHDLVDEGLTLLIIEHDIDLIMENCDHVIVMHQGEVLTEGTPDVVRNDARVIDAYLGG